MVMLPVNMWNFVSLRSCIAVTLLMTIITYALYIAMEPDVMKGFRAPYKIFKNKLESQNSIPSRQLVSIHYYNPPKKMNLTNVFHRCPNKCILSVGKGYYDKDVVLFYGPHLKRMNPGKKRRGQIWILNGREPPSHYDILTAWTGLFNWTMTYRRDSDILNMYGRFDHRPNAFARFPNKTFKFNYVADSTKSSKSKEKVASTAWFASNCNAWSRREYYVRTLRKTHSVDIFGGCGTHTCSKKNTTQCLSMLSQNYKFYLSFESCLCRDYITEKSFNFYTKSLDTVPITRGFGDIYSLYLPPGSFIETASYNGINQLGDFLNYLSKNSTLFSQYFQWRKNYQAEYDKQYQFCELCNRMHMPDVQTRYRRVYKDIHKWFFGSPKVNICTNATDLRN